MLVESIAKIELRLPKLALLCVCRVFSMMLWVIQFLSPTFKVSPAFVFLQFGAFLTCLLAVRAHYILYMHLLWQLLRPKARRKKKTTLIPTKTLRRPSDRFVNSQIPAPKISCPFLDQQK